jgi:hypothetical protein
MGKMKKRVLCLLSVMLIGTLMLSSCGCIKEKEEEGQAEISEGKLKKLPAGWKWYENKEWGLRIGYPRDWEVITYEELPHRISFKRSGKEGILSIGFRPVKEDFNIDEYESYTALIQYFTIGGERGKIVKDVIFAMEPGAKEFVNYRAYVEHNQKLFDFLLSSKPNDPLSLKMLSTVEFIE